MELQGVPILHQGRSCGSTLPRRQCRFHGSGVSSHGSHGAFGPRCAVSVLPIIILHRAWRRSRLGRRSQGYDLEERLAAEPWRQGFEEAEETPPVSIEGQGLPKDLIGTVYRNSPGRLRIGGSKYELGLMGMALFRRCPLTEKGKLRRLLLDLFERHDT